MNVTFYTFSKKLNSTKQPGGGTAYTVTLKSGSSVTAPRIGILWQGGGSPAALNYAYIASYGRYYFVKNWTYEDRQWWADLVVDPLASYKSYIGASSKYILRASASHRADTIDTMWPAKSTFLISGALAGSSLGWANYGSNGGTYVITVVGKNNYAGGNAVCTQYQCGGPALQILLNNMMSAIDGWITGAQSSTTIREAVWNLLNLPFRMSNDLSQFIKGVMWFPFSFPSAGVFSVNLGMFNVGSASAVSAPMLMFSGTCNLPGIAAGKERWEYMAPYGSYWFKLLPFGMFELDPADVVNGSVLTYTVGVDSVSGLGTLTLSIDSDSGNKVIATQSAQVGIAIPYGSAAPNYAGAITAAAAVAGAINGEVASKELIGASIGTAATRGFTGGSAGGGGALEGIGSLYYHVLDHVAIDNAESGRPYCDTATISALPGFIMCKEGDINAPATASELAAIESYLTGGFFYE